MQLGMAEPMDIGIDAANESLGMTAGNGGIADILHDSTDVVEDEAVKLKRRQDVLRSEWCC